MGSGAEFSLPPTPGGVDLVLFSGTIYTQDPGLPRAKAFAVHQGRFVAVGSDDDIQNLVGPETKIIRADERTVTPGFIDAHCHPDGVDELTGADANQPTVKDVMEAMRQKAADTPAEYWVVGVKYDDTKLDRPVTRKDLDLAVPDHPAVVKHRGGHTAVFNSRAFRLAGIDGNTPDPPGGKYYREDGELTGKVAEEGLSVLYEVGKWPEITREIRQRGVEFISKEMASAGITSVHQAHGGAKSLTALQDAYRAGGLRFRMYMFVSGQAEAYEALKTSGIRSGFGDDWLRIGGVKFGVDGSASERTMRMSTPYIGRPDDYGILTMTQQEINEAVMEAHRAGWQIGVHANGDVAIEMVLNAYEKAQKELTREDPRFRIEHCTLVNPPLLERIKAIGAIPTPFYTYVYYHGEKWGEYGEEKLNRMFAHRSFLDYDVPVAPASDYMPGPYEPMMAIQSMVTRTDYRGKVWGPNQKVSVDEALKVCTLNGAYASFEENAKGSITAGKWADFVVLQKDPHKVDPLAIKDIKVVSTFVEGRPTFQA